MVSSINKGWMQWYTLQYSRKIVCLKHHIPKFCLISLAFRLRFTRTVASQAFCMININRYHFKKSFHTVNFCKIHKIYLGRDLLFSHNDLDPTPNESWGNYIKTGLDVDWRVVNFKSCESSKSGQRPITNSCSFSWFVRPWKLVAK